MACYVKISTLGPKPWNADPFGSYKKMVENMKSHWNWELNQVLVDRPDLIVLPELCDCPSNLKGKAVLEYCQCRGNEMLDFFRERAQQNHCYIAYSSIWEKGANKFGNTTQLIDRNGDVIGIYNKNHPTIDEMENLDITPGKDARVIDCDFGRAACLICFDLNFEDLMKEYKEQKPNLLVFSSLYHGGLMANYWAYINRSYLVGAIAGLENYVISPVGEKVAASTNYFDYVTHCINLDYCVVHLDYNWGRLGAAKKKYGSRIKVSDPGYLGAVMVSSETDEFHISQIVREFELELLDDYLKRSLMVSKGR